MPTTIRRVVHARVEDRVEDAGGSAAARSDTGVPDGARAGVKVVVEVSSLTMTPIIES
jgi:hypothetical protein